MIFSNKPSFWLLRGYIGTPEFQFISAGIVKTLELDMSPRNETSFENLSRIYLYIYLYIYVYLETNHRFLPFTGLNVLKYIENYSVK